MDSAQTLAWLRLSASVGEGSFPLRLEAEIHTAQALFSGQRMEKWERSSQINFTPMWEEGFTFKEQRKRKEK